MKQMRQSDWMKSLPIDPGKLTFNELQNFKAAHKLFMGDDLEGPIAWQSYVRSFRFLSFFAMASIAENKFPPLTRCWNDLENNFMSDEIFDDELFIQSWIYFDFPLNAKGETLLDQFQIFIKEAGRSDEFQGFISEMKKSRLGLYQETSSTQQVTKFKELFTGNVLSTTRSVSEYGNGEIFLTRIVENKGEFFQFGDPKCWPKTYRGQIVDMVTNKLFYFDGNNELEEYEQFMKLAGPYWFSCVVTDTSIDIHSPDHYLTYLESH
jgi:hypothetical protein